MSNFIANDNNEEYYAQISMRSLINANGIRLLAFILYMLSVMFFLFCIAVSNLQHFVAI